MHYHDHGATAACVVIRDWVDGDSISEHVTHIERVEPYVPGQFYRRELPCIFKVLDELSPPPAVVVIDGYVWLDADGRPGLGAHLYDTLDQQVPVVGVAKTAFRDASHAVAVLRGRSNRPIYVTAAGMPSDDAADLVRRMAGEHRLPSVLGRVDRLARSR